METNLLNDKEEKIYVQYQNIIAPFIMELEVRDTEYPIEIFNEIRSIFTHLSRYKMQNSDEDILAAASYSITMLFQTWISLLTIRMRQYFLLVYIQRKAIE